MKGITKIELTDVNTGEVKVVEESNFLTNGLKEICRPILRNQDSLATTYFVNEKKCTLEALMRGVLLFDTVLGDNPNLLFAPDNVRMVGHAGDIAYTGSDISMGSFNTNQSDLDSEEERTYIWDFTAEQANGVINSICLTTQTGGVVGYGADTPAAAEEESLRPFSNIIKSAISVNLGGGFTQTQRVPLYLSFANDEITLCDFSSIHTGVLTFYKVKLDANGIDVFTPFAEYTSPSSGNRAINFVGSEVTKVSSTSVNLANDLTVGKNVGTAQDGKYLYVTSMNSSSESSVSSAWAAGSEIKLVKIDLDTLEYEVITVTNTTGVPVAIRGYEHRASKGGHTFGVSNGYMFVRSWVSTVGDNVSELYAINLSDNTNVRKISDESGNFNLIGVDVLTLCAPFTPTVQGRVCFTGKRFKPAIPQEITTEISVFSCVSTTTFVANYFGTSLASLFTQGTILSPGRTNLEPRLISTDNPLYLANEVVTSSNMTSSSIFVYIVPNVLMTINNLSAAIEKTPSQTMRITYKITKE